MTEFFEHDDVKLAYDVTGSADGPPVVLLHGLSTARTNWHGVVPALAERYRVYALDQRGHNESSHAPGTYDLAHYGPDAVAFCEQVVGRPAALVGHSLGGVVAFYVGRWRPDLVRGVFLEDPPLYVEHRTGPSEGVAAFFPTMREMLRGMRGRGATLDEYMAMLGAAPSMRGDGTMAESLGEEGTRLLAEAWFRLDPETFTPAIEGGALSGAGTDAPLDCPVVVVRADPAMRAAFTEEDA